MSTGRRNRILFSCRTLLAVPASTHALDHSTIIGMNSTTSDKPFWEHAYQIPTASVFGKPSAEIIALADKLPSSTAVLDLGCGEGRNALFLAERGFDVTAVDISEHGIGKLRSQAAQRGLQVRAEVADMRRYKWDREFGLIISHGCLHLIERSAWQHVL